MNCKIEIGCHAFAQVGAVRGNIPVLFVSGNDLPARKIAHFYQALF